MYKSTSGIIDVQACNVCASKLRFLFLYCYWMVFLDHLCLLPIRGSVYLSAKMSLYHISLPILKQFLNKGPSGFVSKLQLSKIKLFLRVKKFLKISLLKCDIVIF